MKIEKTKDGWQLYCEKTKRDYHIRKDYGFWTLDIFNSDIEKDHVLAYVNTQIHKSLQDAISDAFADSDDFERD